MKTIAKFDAQKVRLALFVLTMVLFVLGAAAPEDMGLFFR